MPVGYKFIIPTVGSVVAGTDKIPRYKVIPQSPSIYAKEQFAKASGDFVVTTEDDYDEAEYISLFGTPVYSVLDFPTTDALQDFVPVGLLALQAQGVALRIDMAIFTINQTKNIIKTAIQGRNGTIKEYIGDGDYAIQIEGHIVSPFPNKYPKDEVLQFIEIMKVQSQIPMAAPILQMFGINSVVIEKWEINETVGTRNMVSFNINCLSDSDDSITIRNLETIW